jgi:erythromycin esterase
VALVTALTVAGCGTTTVPGWVAETAEPLATTRPADPLDDLAPLRAAAAGADVVGLGESVHGAAEELTLKHRALRVLVEQLGFRSVAWEEDWTTGRRINDFITGGAGDLATLMGRMSPQWQSREVADVLQWLRDFNTGRTDQVQFVGVEYYLTGADAYADVDAYVAGAAPGRLAELRAHLAPIRPATTNAFEHVQAYMAVPDKQPLLAHARGVHDLVAGLPHASGDRAHAEAVHTARQIVSFHEHFALPEPESHSYRDAHAAANLAWWRNLTGDRIAYWAASPHTATARDLRITSQDGELRFTSAGTHLRDRYGARYLSIGFLFDHGPELPAPAEGWFERPLAQPEPFVLDLRGSVPPGVRTWLDAPIVTRGPAGPGSVTTGGTAAQWFDMIVHVDAVTPAGAV